MIFGVSYSAEARQDLKDIVKVSIRNGRCFYYGDFYGSKVKALGHPLLLSLSDKF